MTEVMPPPEPDPPAAERPFRWRWIVVTTVLGLIAVGLAGTWVLRLGDDDAGSAGAPAEVGVPIIEGDTVTYVIPLGTRARKLAGEAIAVIPARIELEVGQTLVLRNEDSDAHIAGPFFVGAGEESSYTFTEPKTIAGDCTIHPSGRFEVVVT